MDKIIIKLFAHRKKNFWHNTWSSNSYRNKPYYKSLVWLSNFYEANIKTFKVFQFLFSKLFQFTVNKSQMYKRCSQSNKTSFFVITKAFCWHCPLLLSGHCKKYVCSYEITILFFCRIPPPPLVCFMRSK